MINQQVTDIFNQIADILEILDEDRFRVNSYRKAARVIKDAGEDLAKLTAEDRLGELPGIGKATSDKIRQFIDSGKVKAHEELLAKIPVGLLQLLEIPGMGPKGTRALWQKLGVESLDDLKKRLDAGEVETLEGFGQKKADAIRKGLAFLEQGAGRIRVDRALALANLIVGALKRQKGIQKLELAGSLRRGCETIGDIDILACTADPDKSDLIEQFTKLAGVQEVLASGKTKGSVRFLNKEIHPEAVQVDLRIVPAESFGAAQNYFTGSKDHNVRLREIAVKKKLKLNEYGLFRGETLVAGKTEIEIYKKLGLAYVTPTLREDRGEIEAAAKNALPNVVQEKDICGDLHMHTTASDGRAEIADHVAVARQRGYRYIAITEHSKSSAIANGLDEKRLLRHVERVRAANDQCKDLTILAGTEVDILTSGKLDYDDKILEQLDFVVASVHAGLGGSRQRNTDRVLKAMENPYVNCIAHPTGRLVNQREPMDLDMEAIFAKAAETGTALEISSQPKRLDLKDVHCRMALAAGVKFLINTDAHDAVGQHLIHFGVATAQRGWVTKDAVMNTKPLRSLQKWIRDKRK